MIFKKMALMGLGFMVAVPLAGYGFSQAFRVRFERVGFGGLPDCLVGLRVLLISDLHGRDPEKMQGDIWPILMGLEFDLVVVAGDVILDEAAQLRPHLEGLRGLARKAPLFYVEGNHESFCYGEISRMIEGLGGIALHNRQGLFSVGAVKQGRSPVVSVVGFRDYYWQRRDRFRTARRLIDGLDRGFHIILSHQPQIFDLLRQENLSGLVLAGHTHGGQLRLPFMPTLYAPGQGPFPRYGDGIYSNNHLKMYVSRGVGATHFSLRLFNPPEVSLIELSRKD